MPNRMLIAATWCLDSFARFILWNIQWRIPINWRKIQLKEAIKHGEYGIMLAIIHEA
jgi:hypothetical protein